MNMKAQARTESASALCGQMVRVGNMAQVYEFAEAHGRFKTKLTIPHASDLADFIRIRDMVARLETQALMERLSARRIELFEQAGEQRRIMESIDQRLVMEDEFDNVVTTVGKNQMLDAALAGSSYTVTGPFMFLIGAASYTGAPVASDTMSSHGTWTEAGSTNAPTYTAPRKTAAWSAASAGSKSLSANLTFSITGTGTAKGCGLVYGSGAVSTIDNTGGVMYSAGLFTGGDQPVVNGNTLSVSYSTSL